MSRMGQSIIDAMTPEQFLAACHRARRHNVEAERVLEERARAREAMQTYAGAVKWLDEKCRKVEGDQ